MIEFIITFTLTIAVLQTMALYKTVNGLINIILFEVKTDVHTNRVLDVQYIYQIEQSLKTYLSQILPFYFFLNKSVHID